jgi:SAM-dependent methyltransferase
VTLNDLRDSWNELAAKDAFQAVLTRSAAATPRWDPDAFFRTGVDEVEFILHRVGALGATAGSARALDFGCGLGRVTQALCRHFAHVDGVDIAAAMVERARSFNRFAERCTYHLNEKDDLRLFADATFDFVYSNITLQHIEPQYSRRYIEEFFRVLKPNGITVFQLPSDPVPDVRPSSRSSRPLPRAACLASIDAPAALRCAPRAVLPLQIFVRNLGAGVWPAASEHDGPFSIRLGNHWRRRFWRTLRFDDRRTALPHDVSPGETATMGMPVEAPDAPGTYVLELDMVQENVRWFAEAGSKPARIRVRVDDALAPGTVEGLPKFMAMHGMPRPDVEALIGGCGAVLLAADEDQAPGPTWTSFRYVARRQIGGVPRPGDSSYTQP